MLYLPIMNTKKPWQEFFWRQVRKMDSCWVWTGSTDPDGYGRFGSAHTWSRSYMETKEVRAHRISWVLAYGPIAEGLWVLHDCDSPPCVNPEHLHLGDNYLNSRTRDIGGRHRGIRGEQCPWSPLTEKAVREIRALWETGVFSQAAIGAMYGVNQSCVSEIVRGKTWRNLL
jgi:hypothetical protein